MSSDESPEDSVKSGHEETVSTNLASVAHCLVGLDVHVSCIRAQLRKLGCRS